RPGSVRPMQHRHSHELGLRWPSGSRTSGVDDDLCARMKYRRARVKHVTCSLWHVEYGFSVRYQALRRFSRFRTTVRCRALHGARLLRRTPRTYSRERCMARAYFAEPRGLTPANAE